MIGDQHDDCGVGSGEMYRVVGWTGSRPAGIRDGRVSTAPGAVGVRLMPIRQCNTGNQQSRIPGIEYSTNNSQIPPRFWVMLINKFLTNKSTEVPDPRLASQEGHRRVRCDRCGWQVPEFILGSG